MGPAPLMVLWAKMTPSDRRGEPQPASHIVGATRHAR
jgi:hypothetical protein